MIRRRPRWLMSVGCVFSLSACMPPVDPCGTPDQRTIVFYDQSASSRVDAPTAAMFKDSLAAIATNALPCQNDALHAFVVHGHTRAKLNRIDVVNPVLPPDTLNGTTVSKALAVSEYEKSIRPFRDTSRDQLLRVTGMAVEPKFRRNTDLLGTLEVISDEVGKGDPASPVRIYFFSDMRESMPAPRRDFDSRPPKDRAEAEIWADADTAVFSQMSLDRTRFQKAEVRVLMGNLAAKPNAEAVRFYWERLFRNAGFDSTRVRFN